MTLSLRLTKNDSADIAFTEACLMSGAVTQDEFRVWLYHVIENHDDIPTYIFDLIDLEDMREIFRGGNGPIGFYPISDFNDEESNAITGIAYKRGYYDRELDYDVYIDRSEALEALDKNPQIERRFREMFPFIDW